MKSRLEIGRTLDAEIADLHSKGFGQKLIARMLSEKHGLEITKYHTRYAFKRLGLDANVGSPNGGRAVNGKEPISKAKHQAQKIKKENRRKEIESYQGFRDLPLLSHAWIFRNKYQSDDKFRKKSIQKTSNWKSNNPEKAKEHSNTYWRKWAEHNPEKMIEINRNHRSKPEVKVMNNLRRRVRDVVRGKGYSATAVIRSIGCTRAELIEHIEQQFRPGMTWDNYGEWHIDHIIPISSGRRVTLDETIQSMTKLSHYTNLQPLWAADNIAKSNKIAP